MVSCWAKIFPSSGPQTKPKIWGGGRFDAKKIATAKDDELLFKGIICKKVESQGPSVLGGPVLATVSPCHGAVAGGGGIGITTNKDLIFSLKEVISIYSLHCLHEVHIEILQNHLPLLIRFTLEMQGHY